MFNVKENIYIFCSWCKFDIGLVKNDGKIIKCSKCKKDTGVEKHINKETREIEFILKRWQS